MNNSVRLALMIFLVLPVLPFGVNMCWGQASMTDMRSTWERQTKKAEITALFAQEKLQPAYQRMVKADMEKAQRAGSLELLIDLRAELARIEQHLSIPDPLSTSADVLRLQKLLSTELDKIETTRSQAVLRLSQGYRLQLRNLQLALTKQGDIEGAIATKAELATLMLRPEFRFLSRLAVRGANPLDWPVMFRGKNPFYFGSGKNDDATYAPPLDGVPEDMQYMRLAHLETKDFVVLKLSRDEFLNGMTEGTYQWRHGTNSTHALLGVADFSTRKKDRRIGAFFGVKGDYSGWGYAPRLAYPEEGAEIKQVVTKQGLCWAGEDLSSATLLEVSVSSKPLSELNQAKLLINPERKPVKPDRADVAKANSNLPARLPRSLLLEPKSGIVFGAAKNEGGGVKLGNGTDKGRVSWDLSKIRQGVYDVHVTYSSNSGGMLSVQGVRPTSAGRSKIVLERINIVTRKTRELAFRRDVYAKLQLGGFTNLELILSPRTGYNDSATIHRVEVTAPAR